MGGVVKSSDRALPKIRLPRSWGRERVRGTHEIYNGWFDRGGKGSGKGTAEIPQFGCGWRRVHLESEGRKWAHLIECGTGTKAKVELELWHRMVRKGKVL